MKVNNAIDISCLFYGFNDTLFFVSTRYSLCCNVPRNLLLFRDWRSNRRRRFLFPASEISFFAWQTAHFFTIRYFSHFFRLGFVSKMMVFDFFIETRIKMHFNNLPFRYHFHPLPNSWFMNLVNYINPSTSNLLNLDCPNTFISLTCWRFTNSWLLLTCELPPP